MARVLGKAGRYVEDQSVKKAQQYVLFCLIGVFVCATLAGFLFGRSVSTIRVSPWLSLPLILLTLGLVLLGNRMLQKKTDAIERDRISFRKGAVGEALIGLILEGLPDNYVIINDLSTAYGNLDAVVIGPTGIFAVDAKNWKGVVEADGNGELLLNGRPTTKPEVKNLVRTIMSCREQILSLCKARRLQTDLYIRAVLAFPSARVEAKWGSVKNADCVTDEALLDYIQKDRGNRKLSKDEVEIISRAFLSLARMDEQFPDKP